MPITVEFPREDFVGLCSFLIKERKSEESSLNYYKSKESESAKEHADALAAINRWLGCLYGTETESMERLPTLLAVHRPRQRNALQPVY